MAKNKRRPRRPFLSWRLRLTVRNAKLLFTDHRAGTPLWLLLTPGFGAFGLWLLTIVPKEVAIPIAVFIALVAVMKLIRYQIRRSRFNNRLWLARNI